MKKICVVGGRGYVGRAVRTLFDQDNRFEVWIKEAEHFHNVMRDADVSIICVPTEMKSDGSCDTSIVEEVIKKSDCPFYLIKSTVPPGTTRRLIKETGKRIVFSPEYIGEGSYPIPFWENHPHPTDMSLHSFQIFGGNREDTKEMVHLFSKVLGPYCRFIQTDSVTAELTKYMENSFYAAKVVFCHEFYRIAEHLGVDYNELRELWLLDGRINRGSTSVFDPEKLGFGGKRLPKDINALYKSLKDQGFNSDLLKQVIDTNEDLKGE